MTVDTDLATLREQLRHLGPWRGAVGDEALDRVETELARLRERERDLEDYYEKHQTELARLREGLRHIVEYGGALPDSRIYEEARALLAEDGAA